VYLEFEIRMDEEDGCLLDLLSSPSKVRRNDGFTAEGGARRLYTSSSGRKC